MKSYELPNSEPIPTTLDQFRNTIANALAVAEAPCDLTEEIANVDYEGGGVFSAIWNCWVENFEEQKPESEDNTERYFFWEIRLPRLEDALYEIFDQYEYSFNYAPGSRRKIKDAGRLAERAMCFILGEKVW